jgi:ATP-dependent protease ClpP protease subunit
VAFLPCAGRCCRPPSAPAPVEDALERDYFLTGEMAMEWGIVDKVINKRPEDPEALKVV